MNVDEYLNANKRKRRALARRAIRGNKEAQKELSKLTNALKAEVNKRMRQLTKSNLNYGKQYNYLLQWIDNLNTNRLASARELGYDYDDMLTQNEIAYKFLKSGWSSVQKARETESYRIETLKRKEILPENFSRRKSVEFLRWLGDESSTEAMDQYGTSDIFVEMAFDVYQEKGKAGLVALSRNLTEFLDHQITFDEAMERVGIKVEDYYNKAKRSRTL